MFFNSVFLFYIKSMLSSGTQIHQTNFYLFHSYESNLMRIQKVDSAPNSVFCTAFKIDPAINYFVL